ncbi:MAG: hypothetical protein JO081_18065 [Alphaproteobacteria bacterium]|nr:hypothetical protein [Alphaproteobacteria bacterium]
MQQLTAALSRLAPPPRLYLHKSDGVEEPTGRRGRRYWVVSRRLCRFFQVPLLPDATASRQFDALALQVKRLSPFAETGSHHDFGLEFASLWLWDQQAVRQEAETVGVNVAQTPVVPETVLLPADTDGVRLVRTLEGIEAQCWRNGSLAASRWWPSLPDARAWMLFQRGASILPERIAPALPAAVRLDWLDRPWTRSRRASAFDIGQVDLRLVAAVVGAMMLIAYGYLGAEWLRLAWATSALTRQAVAASAAGKPARHARVSAFENEAAIRALQDLDRYPGELALFARVTEILPKNETHLAEWTWEHGQLEMTVAADHPLDALYFVRSLEKIDGFRNVAAERAGGDNSLRIRLSVDPK